MPIRHMHSDDIDTALALINEEGWNYTRVELERMLKLDPQGSFICEAGRPLGIVTSISYGHTGVIGHLVVSKKGRGRRIGWSLMNEVVDYLDGAGADSILLYATQEGVKLYEKFGFSKRRQALCIFAEVPRNMPRPTGDHIKELNEGDYDNIVALDAGVFGDDRSKLIRSLCCEFPQHSFKVERRGELSGFVLARETPIGYDIGPWVSTSSDHGDAVDLLGAVVSSIEPRTMFLGVFSENRNALKIAEGFKKVRSWVTELMIRGKDRYGDGVDGIYGVAGFELG